MHYSTITAGFAKDRIERIYTNDPKLLIELKKEMVSFIG